MDTKALRQKILDLAIRGKLVPQNPDDESASVLLEKIRAEKQQMVKEGKLKAKDIKNDTIIFKGEDNLHYEKLQDGTVKCIEDEIPFEVPEGWAWARIGTIATFIGGYAYKSNKYVQQSNNLLIRIGNIKNDSINTNIAKVCISDEYATETLGYLLCENDILFTMTGTRGKRDYFFSCRISEKDLNGSNLFLNQRVGCLRLIDGALILSTYFVKAIQSTFILDAIFATETGNVNQGNISSTATMNLLIPIPPTNEQYRLFEKTNIMLTTIKQYNTETEELLNLVQATKTKILDLAVRGKLVPQNPNDEPASVLLESIRTEREELIKQGKIKRDKKESVIFKGDDNSYYEKIGNEIRCVEEKLPFELPDNWMWCNLYNVSDIVMGTSPSGENICDSPNFLEFHQGKLYFSDYIISCSNQYTKEITKTATADSVLLCVRAPVGEVNLTDRPICIGRGLAAIKPYDSISKQFLFYWLQAFKSTLVSKANGTTFVAVTTNVVKCLMIPIPPLKEQTRILSQINSVFNELNKVEKSLS